MATFIGVSLPHSPDSLIPQICEDSYEEALREIEHFVGQTDFEIHTTEAMMGICYGHQKFYLTRSPLYLHSNLQHFIVTSTQDEYFIETIVECLMILKEHFPSKIQIEIISEIPFISNLARMTQEEIPRRLIGRLKILAEQSKKNKKLNKSKIDDLIYILGKDHHKDYRHKLVMLTLNILAQSPISKQLWNSLSKDQVTIIDEITSDPLYQKQGIEVLERIVRHNQGYFHQNYKESAIDKENQNPNISGNNKYRQDEGYEVEKFDGPLDIHSALFQLKESNNINRISWIVSTLDLSQIGEKRLTKVDQRLRAIGKKVIKDEFKDAKVGQMKNFARCFSDYFMVRQLPQDQELVEKVLMKVQIKDGEGTNKSRFQRSGESLA